MKYFLKVTPRAKETTVEQVSANTLFVRVSEPPVDGRANAAVIAAVAGFFGVAKSRLRLTAGIASRTKMIEVLD